jgi:predicted phosphoribosyltransferase
MFANRLDAGRQLAAALGAYTFVDPVVIGVYRGGVPVAAEVATLLHAPLEVCFTRKVFSPGSPSFAIGAIAEHGSTFLDETEIAKLHLSRLQVSQAIAFEDAEVTRLAELLRDAPPVPLAGRDVILVDDAITALHVLRAATASISQRNPASLTLAVPLASSSLLARVRPEFTRVVCLLEEPSLVSAGSRYVDFGPVFDNEVAAALAGSRRELPPLRRAS